MGKSELQQACEDKGITITSVHMELEWEPNVKHPMDVWNSTLHYNGQSATFRFRTGIGHRVLGFGWKADGPERWYSQSNGHIAKGFAQAVAMGALVIKRERDPETKKSSHMGPSVADVVHSCLSDSRACTTTFDDWCSDFGCNNDSLKALNTYLECQRVGSKIIRLLGTKLANELSKKEH